MKLVVVVVVVCAAFGLSVSEAKTEIVYALRGYRSPLLPYSA